MTDGFSELPDDQLLMINRLCNQFELSWQSGREPFLEDLLHDVAPSQRSAVIAELLPIELAYRRNAGHPLSLADCRARFPELPTDRLHALFNDATVAVDQSPSTGHDPALMDSAPQTRPPHPSLQQFPEHLGDYDIIEHIGRGGMGSVYRAVHRRMDRMVALKVLRPEIRDDPRLRLRFEREMRVAARLSHPNIVQAYDARVDDGLYYLIMEFVDGSNLDVLVKRDGPLSVARSVDIIIQAARGLSAAHQRGVTHRDIKPGNLLLDRAGTVKILDMGLARYESAPVEATPHTELTTTGLILGTAAYMAPEQARNMKNADVRSDIYSLGCTLFFLLTGRPPYRGETVVETILAHSNESLPSLASAANGKVIPNALENIFRRMLAKRPQDRFQTMDEIILELETLINSTRRPSENTQRQDVRLAETPQHTEPGFAKPEPDFATSNVTSAIPDGNASEPIADPVASVSTNGSQHPAKLYVSVAAALVLLISAVSYSWWINRPPEIVPGIPSRHALRFNGDSSFISVPSLATPPTSPVTLEAIVDLRGQRVSNIITWLGPNMMALFQSGRNEWGIARREGSESHLIVSETFAEMGRTVHLAGIWDGTSLELFVDGVPVESHPLPNYELPTLGEGLYIGGVPPRKLPEGEDIRFFEGVIYTVRLSRGVRYRDAFQPPAAFDTDAETIAVYRFDEGTGTQVSDTRGSYPGTLTDVDWIDVPRPTGQTGQTETGNK